MIRRIAAAFVICVAALVLSVTAQLAYAAPATHTRSATQPFSCQDSRCSALRSVPREAALEAHCWRDRNSYAGSSRWFRVTYEGSRGWVSTGVASTPQPKLPHCSDLQPSEQLFNGESLWSPNGRYHLNMQGDGNLVVYGPSGAIRASDTGGTPGYFAATQTDGNFVVCDRSDRPIFATGTTGYRGTSFVMQSDSNLVDYRPDALWASNRHAFKGERTVAINKRDVGDCTWYALERWKGFWLQHAYPAASGDAYQRTASARSLGYNVQTQPATQAIVMFAPGVGGSDSSNGHVAWVDDITPRSNGTYINAWEMNWNGFDKVDDRWVEVAAGMSFITAQAI